MKVVSASAPGKCILFGDQAVVPKTPAIAMAISRNSNCKIERLQEEGIQIILSNYKKTLEFSNYNDLISNIPKNLKQLAQCMKMFKELYYTKLEKMKITLSSELIPSYGLGSSASTAASFVSALGEFCNLKLDKTQISGFTYEMEKITHDTPSVIDATVCCFGKMIYFQEDKFQFIPFSNKFKFLITYTNLVHDTKITAKKEKRFRKKNPEKHDQIFKEIGNIVKKAEIELKDGNLSALGRLMNSNQALLAKSCVPKGIDADIISISHENGALGSILTGNGLGRSVITLGTEDVLKNITLILKERGYESFLTSIDCKGVMNERS